MTRELTTERIAKHYPACLDNVGIINDAITNSNKYIGDDTVIQRNVKHLKGMRNADFWTNEDMTRIDGAIALANSVTA